MITGRYKIKKKTLGKKTSVIIPWHGKSDFFIDCVLYIYSIIFFLEEKWYNWDKFSFLLKLCTIFIHFERKNPSTGGIEVTLHSWTMYLLLHIFCFSLKFCNCCAAAAENVCIYICMYVQIVSAMPFFLLWKFWIVRWTSYTI